MSTPSPKTRRLFSCLGCLVAGPLGCLSFLGGGVAVGVFFTPELIEEVLANNLPRKFRQEFRGELTFEDIDLAWTEVQRVDGLVLRDDEGRTVLSGDLELPPLLSWISPEDGLGVSTLRLDGEILVDRDGISNLDRALALDSGSKLKKSDVKLSFPTNINSDLHEIVNFFFETEGSVVLQIGQLDWTIEDESGQSGITAKALQARLNFGGGEPLFLELNGRIDGLHSGVNDGSINLKAHVARNAFFPDQNFNEPGVWGAAVAKGIPTELFDLLPLSDRSLQNALAESFGVRVSIDAPGENGAGVFLTFDSDQLYGTVSGELKSKGLLAIYPREDEVEQLQLDLSLRGFERETFAEFIGFPALGDFADSRVRWDWEASQELSGSVENLEWVRRGDTRTIGRFNLDLPDSTVSMSPNHGVDIFDPKVTFRRGEGSEWITSASGFVGAMDAGELKLDFICESLDDSNGEAERFALRGFDVQCNQIPIPDLDASLGMSGQLLDAFGPVADLRALYSSAAEEGGEFSFNLQSDRTSADFVGTVLGDPQSLDEWLGALDFNGEMGAGSSAWIAALVPGSTNLEWSDGLEIDYAGWRERTVVEGDDVVTEIAPVSAVVSERPVNLSGGNISLSVPRLTYRSDPSSADDFELAMTDVSLSARGDSDVLRIDIFADVESGGEMEEHWIFYSPIGPFGRDGREDLRLRATAKDLSSSIIDSRIGTDGLVEELFGPVVAVELNGGGLSAEGGRFDGSIGSNRAMLSLVGFRESRDVLTDTQLSLDFLLDERLSDRLVRPLLPYLDHLAAPKDKTSHVRMTLRDGTVPMNGDLANLSGKLSVELGEVEMAFSERFRSFLVEEEVPAGLALHEAVQLPPLELLLADGQVTCERVELPVRGTPTLFEGTYGLGGTDLDMQIELPLKMVGGEANLLLDNMRDQFQPDLGVPLELSGATMAELDMSVRPQWFRTVSDILDQFVPESLRDGVRGILTEDE